MSDKTRPEKWRKPKPPRKLAFPNGIGDRGRGPKFPYNKTPTGMFIQLLLRWLFLKLLPSHDEVEFFLASNRFELVRSTPADFKRMVLEVIPYFAQLHKEVTGQEFDEVALTRLTQHIYYDKPELNPPGLGSQFYGGRHPSRSLRMRQFYATWVTVRDALEGLPSRSLAKEQVDHLFGPGGDKLTRDEIVKILVG